MKIIAFSDRTIDTIPVPRELPKFVYDLLNKSVVMTAHFDDGRTYSKFLMDENSNGGDFPSEAKTYYAALQPKENIT
jgi:hypothetical protein